MIEKDYLVYKYQIEKLELLVIKNYIINFTIPKLDFEKKIIIFSINDNKSIGLSTKF